MIKNSHSLLGAAGQKKGWKESRRALGNVQFLQAIVDLALHPQKKLFAVEMEGSAMHTNCEQFGLLHKKIKHPCCNYDPHVTEKTLPT